MFVANQLSDYISFYYKYRELSNEQMKEKSNLKAAFIEKETVCIGYAMAFERCISALGIECKIVKGEGRGGLTEKTKNHPSESDHAWNVVKIKDNWYNIDVTWLSTIKDSIKQSKNEVVERSCIKNYILSSDDDFIEHYKLEENGINCKESLKDKVEIYDRVKMYKNVLEEYDNGKRNSMLQINIEKEGIKKEDINKDEVKIPDEQEL